MTLSLCLLLPLLFFSFSLPLTLLKGGGNSQKTKKEKRRDCDNYKDYESKDGEEGRHSNENEESKEKKVFSPCGLPPTWVIFLLFAKKHVTLWMKSTSIPHSLPPQRLFLLPMKLDGDMTDDNEDIDKEDIKNNVKNKTNKDSSVKKLREYSSLCGFGESDVKFVPLTYPLVLLFKLQCLLVLDDNFPFSGLGLIHLTNIIHQWKELSINKEKISSCSPYSAVVYCDQEVLWHKKGYCFTIISEVYEERTDTASCKRKELIWQSKSVMLSLHAHASCKPPDGFGAFKTDIISEEQLESCTGATEWSCPENFGRRFAALSDDYNPIHLHRIPAALFGYVRGHIVHGMCICAKALAAIQCEDGEAIFYVNKYGSKKMSSPVTFYVEFIKPVYLPGSVLLQTATHEETYVNSRGKRVIVDGCFFQVLSAKNNASPHVVGYISIES